jgi:hypothetical protein
MQPSSLLFFEERQFHTFMTADATYEAFCHLKTAGTLRLRVFHLISRQTHDEVFWIDQSKRFTTLESLINAYPELGELEAVS